jgi:hypothetical protein
MFDLHPALSELERYVTGTELDAARAARVEAHVAGCDGCAAALAGQARFELALAEVARQLPARPRGGASRPTGRPVRVAARIAAAAAAALAVVGGARWLTASAEPSVADPAAQTAGYADAGPLLARDDAGRPR